MESIRGRVFPVRVFMQPIRIDLASLIRILRASAQSNLCSEFLGLPHLPDPNFGSPRFRHIYSHFFSLECTKSNSGPNRWHRDPVLAMTWFPRFRERRLRDHSHPTRAASKQARLEWKIFDCSPSQYLICDQVLTVQPSPATNASTPA
jgi:hypothetical protein